MIYIVNIVKFEFLMFNPYLFENYFAVKALWPYGNPGVFMRFNSAVSFWLSLDGESWMERIEDRICGVLQH